MTKMRKTIVLGLFIAGVLLLQMPAAAQLRFGTDFTTSDTVWSVTNVKVKSNMMPYYLEGIKQTWVSGNEVSKELGQIEDWAIYQSMLPDSGAYNLTLVVQFKDLAQYDKGRVDYKQFEEAWLKKLSEEKREEIVGGYPEMRTIVGEYLVRAVDFK